MSYCSNRIELKKIDQIVKIIKMLYSVISSNIDILTGKHDPPVRGADYEPVPFRRSI